MKDFFLNKYMSRKDGHSVNKKRQSHVSVTPPPPHKLEGINTGNELFEMSHTPFCYPKKLFKIILITIVPTGMDAPNRSACGLQES
jgi:hypothetical protein